MDLISTSNILYKLGYRTKVIRNSNFYMMGQTIGRNDENTLRYLIDLKYFDNKIATSSALLINECIDLEKIDELYEGGILICENAKECFFALNIYLYENTNFFGKEYNSMIDDTASIGENVKISKTNVRIGKNVVIEDNVIIYSNVEIGDYTKICSGTILGNEGVMLCTIKGKKTIVPHAGKLTIGNNVVIMNNVIVQKGINTSANTVIRQDAIIGSNVLISHGTKIGKGTLILENVNIAGYCNIGNDIWIGAGCVIKNGISIGHNAHIALGSVIIEDVDQNTEISGFFGVNRFNSLILHEKLKRGKI